VTHDYLLAFALQEHAQSSVQVSSVQHPLGPQQVLESLQQVQQEVLVSIGVFSFLVCLLILGLVTCRW